MADTNPILGIAEWLAQESRLDDAKTVLESVRKSKRSSERDIKESEQLAKSIKLKSREAIAKTVKKVIVVKKVDKLLPHPDIEKKIVIKIRDYEKIKKDIDERGVQVPLVINDEGKVICGITRLKACKELGIADVPCFEGSWDLYHDMLDYAVKDNIMRRQLSDEEKSSLEADISRSKDEVVVGRPPGVPEAVTKKAEKIISKAKKKAAPTAQATKRITDKVLEKEYKWVVGKDHHKDSTFPSMVGDEIKKQLELLKMDKAEIKIKVSYEVKL